MFEADYPSDPDVAIETIARRSGLEEIFHGRSSLLSLRSSA